MRSFYFTLLFFIVELTASGQVRVKGVVADSVSHKPLPFATIKADGKRNICITGINGQFSVLLEETIKEIQVSYISHATKTISVSALRINDTIFLAPSVATLGEVIVRPQREKIKRIINAAISNKSLHNPEMYDMYQCNVYYQMKADFLPSRPTDSVSVKRNFATKEKVAVDTTNLAARIDAFNARQTHLAFSETFSHRMYKRPQQLQETIIASRFSGFKKTYFTNLVTDVLPFHVYGDYIMLNGRDYINPISRGWQQRYKFFLADEVIDASDTTFIFSFDPKPGAGFNALHGMVYINSDGYAISHFTGAVGDTSVNDREIKIEQVYEKVNGKWFPKELNYEVTYRQFLVSGLGFTVNGHSIIDSVSFVPDRNFHIEKAYSVKLGDSVDLHSEQDWEKLRSDTISLKDRNTFRIMDSIFEKRHIERFISAMGKLVVGRLPFKMVDIDLTRLIATNDYENTRLGVGLYTNERISKFYSLGGWMGYGLMDKRTKFGLSFTAYAQGNKDNWLELLYNDDYQNAGNVHIHEDIDRDGYRTWLLAKPDRVQELGVVAHTQRGYWEIDGEVKKQKLSGRYLNLFTYGGKNYNQFDVREAGVGLRFAYGEKRVPAFGYYFPVATKFPIFYFRTTLGNAQSGNDYSVNYFRALAAVHFWKHINRWGYDGYRIEGGFIHSFNGEPLSRSFLLASKGFERGGVNFYAVGGFLTMRPYDYSSDRYISFLYRHDFDKFLWKLKFSKPFLSIAHNMLYGNMTRENRLANPDIVPPASGYQESGIILNQLLQKNILHSSFLYLNAGVFYHWTSSLSWNKNGVFVIGFAAGF